MANENKNINELVSDEDPTTELEAVTFRDDTASRAVLLEADDCTFDLDEHRENVERDSRELGKLRFELEQLRAKWTGLETELKAREEITHKLNDELGEIREELAQKDRLLRHGDATISALTAEICDLEILHHDVTSDLRRQIDGAKKSVRLLPELPPLSDVAVDDLDARERIARTEQYADVLRRKLQDALTQQDEVCKERDRLSRSLDLAHQTERKLEREVAELTSERDELGARLDVIGAEHAEEIRILRFELGEAQDTVTQTEELNAQLASDLVDTRGFKEELERMLSESDELSRSRIEKLESELARVSQVALDLEEKLDARSDAINVLLAELARKSRQIEPGDSLDGALHDHEDRIAEQFDDEECTALPTTRSPDRVTRVLVGRAGDKLLRFPLFKGKLTIGRTADNDIQLNAPYISRRHAVVTTDGERTRVIDWGSKNGVYVNSKRVSEHFLESGDVVTIGNVHFRYDERPKRDA